MTSPRRKAGDPKLTPRSPFGMRPPLVKQSKGLAKTAVTSTAGSPRPIGRWLRPKLVMARALLTISAILMVSLLLWVTVLLLRSPSR